MRPDNIVKVLSYEYWKDLYNTYYSHRSSSVIRDAQSKKCTENKIMQVGNNIVIDISAGNYSVR